MYVLLSNRSQIVVLNGINSDEVKVKSSVPQGSVLGPTLFTIFINDQMQLIAKFAYSLTIALYTGQSRAMKMSMLCKKILILCSIQSNIPAQGVNQLSRYPIVVQTSISFHTFQVLQSYGTLCLFTSETKEH